MIAGGGAVTRTVSFITMGCAKNEVDSAHMAERLVSAGYSINEDPDRADAVIVNTCSFIQEATEESIEAVLDAAACDAIAQRGALLVVAGCMPARYGADLEAEFPEVAAFVPCKDEERIAEILDGLFDADRNPGRSEGSPATEGGAEGCILELAEPSAYVKISDGCDRFCAYCAIPYIRGRYRSFAYEDIAREVQARIAQGAREIVLIAQDTGRWGADFEEPSTLARLMARLAEQHPDTWFRVLYIQPEGVTDELLETVAAHANICDYFDIPFQHAVQRVLRSMNRKGSGAEFLDLLGRIRARIPQAALRTTLIAGYPGETDDDFEQLCAFVEEAPLDYIGVFAYSREEGTRAFDLGDQIDEDEKRYRAQRLRDLADNACAARIAKRIDSETDVLVCGCEEDGQLFGRTSGQAPDVDGVTYLDGGEIGEIVRVRIVDTLLYEMEGELLA